MTPDRWQQIKALFDRALDHEPDTRLSFVRSHCDGDDGLRREVESLLEADEAGGSRLEHPAIRGPSTAHAPLSAGTVLVDRYEIQQELGRGGMSIVYLAQDRQLLSRRVVIKVLRQETNQDPYLRQKFLQEMEALARIDHPGVVGVLAAGLTPEGQQFLVMQFIEGGTLRQAIHPGGPGGPGGMEPQRAAGILRQIGQALDAAHGKGIWHRDVKPENVMLQNLGGEDHVKLIDFGIAGIQNSQFADEQSKVAGSLSYMAPEQYAGHATAASDTYSLGVVAYEILTGAAPGPGSAGKLSPGVSALIQKAMSYDPAARQPSPGVFADQLARALLGTVAFDAVEISGGKRRLTRLTVRQLSMGGVVLIAAGAALWFGLLSGPGQPSIAVLPFVDLSPAKDQQYFSEGVAEELLNALAKIPGLRVAGRNSSFQFAGKVADYRLIGQKLNVATILEGSVGKQGNRTKITTRLIKVSDGYQLWSETYHREMNDIFAVQEEIARAVAGALKVTLSGGKGVMPAAKGPSAEAYNAYLQGRYFFERRTKANVEKAVGYFEQATRIDPNYAAAWAWLAESRSREAVTGSVDPKATYELARQAAQRALTLEPNLGDAHAAMAWIQQFDEWDWPAADASYQRALALAPGNATVISHAAVLARSLGRLDEATTLGRRAMELDPLNAGACYDAGLSFYTAGRRDEGAAAFRKVLELIPEREIVHFYLGRIHLADARPQQALTEMEREKHPAFRPMGMALAYHALGRKKESDASLGELIEKFGHAAQYFIAAVYAFRGEKDRAFQYLDQAYVARQPALVNFKSDPLMQNLADDARYAALLKKLKLPR